jgi:hypothetical protein
MHTCGIFWLVCLVVGGHDLDLLDVGLDNVVVVAHRLDEEYLNGMRLV